MQRHLPQFGAPVVGRVGQAFTQIARAAMGHGPAQEAMPVVLEPVGDAKREDDHQGRRRRTGDRRPPGPSAHPGPAREAAQTGIQDDGEEQPQPGADRHADTGDERDVMALRDGRRRGRVDRVEELGAISDHDQHDGGRDGRKRTAEQALGTTDQHVEDEGDRTGGDRASREGEEERCDEQRHHRRREDPSETLLAERAGHVEREQDAQRGEQAQRVPVGDRVAQALVGHVGAGMQYVGKHAAGQARHAYDRRTDHETPDQPAEVLPARPYAAEQDEDQQVEPRAVEVDQRSARRVRPKGREERHERVAPKGGDRDERDGRQPLERPAGKHDPDEQDLGKR